MDCCVIAIQAAGHTTGDKPSIPVQEYNPLWALLKNHPKAETHPTIAAPPGHKDHSDPSFDALEPEVLVISEGQFK